MANIDVNTPAEDENSTAQPMESQADSPVSAPETAQDVSMSSEPSASSNPEPAVTTPVASAPEPVKLAMPSQPKAKRAMPSTMQLVHYGIDLVLVIVIIVMALSMQGLKSDNADLSKELATVKSNPQALVQQQTDALIAKVGALMTLPSGETPTVAEVSDATAAKKQSAFFANAENGDKVLMYAKAGTAILYRPSTNKIVLVAPLTFNK